MSFSITPSSLKGKLHIPSSKSQTLRALLFALMAEGKSVIKNPLLSSDTQAMIQAILSFGAKVNIQDRIIEVEGVGKNFSHATDVIDAKNSGIVFRFITAIASLGERYCVITGDHSIQTRRPIAPLLEALNQLGVFAESMRKDGHAPVIIRGKMCSGKTALDGADSQPISALLIASAFTEGKTMIHVSNPGEKPWVQMTLDWFDRLGIRYINQDYKYYEIEGSSSYEGFSYTVSSDFSTLAFPLVATIITSSSVQLSHFDMTDSQGDKKLIDILKEMGAKIEVNKKQGMITLKPGSQLLGGKIDLNQCIDALPILSVLACYAKGKTHLYNAKIARKKECDRISVMRKELTKMGAEIEEKEDGLIIYPSSLKGAQLSSHQDHRVAMSLCVAALGAVGKSQINHIECIEKTYPTFLTDWQKAGVAIEESK